MRIKIPVASVFVLAAILAACGGGGGGTTGAPTYTVGGVISGLTGTVVLRNNGGDDLPVSASGPFEFPAGLADGATFEVTVSARPAGQSCLVSNGTGTIAGANVVDVAVDCTTNSTLADIESAVTATVLSLTGNELSLPTVTGSGYAITTLGYALCPPPDPYAAPAAQPVPPDNIYGCQNSATVVVTPGADSITFTYSVPEIFVDVETYSVLTGTDAAYVLATDITATVTASLSTTEEGMMQIGPVQSSSLSSSSIAFHTQDTVVQNVANMLVGAYQPDLESGLNDFLSAFTNSVITALPPYEP